MWCRISIKTGLLLCLIACGGQKQRVVSPAFYHWQTALNLAPSERQYLDSFRCKRLYIKVLDVGWNSVSGEAAPYSLLDFSAPGQIAGLEKVPVVFITNEVFSRLSTVEIEWLARKINGVLVAFKMAPGVGPFTEVQFDCDWTPSTREAFFLFLKKMKTCLPEKTRMSATIRLHQYKFPDQTGVPPVDRGMLMFYNTGDIENAGDQNSIFNAAAARKYTEGAPKHYPLPLDLALPLFSWGLVYRNGELWKIIPEVAEETWADTARFTRIGPALPEEVRRYEVKNGTFLSGHYLRPGDTIRVETISPARLLEAARLASTVDLAEHTTVAFFHLDSLTIRRYSASLLDSVCRTICFPEIKN